MCVNNKEGEELVVEVKEEVSSKDLKKCAVLRVTRKKTPPKNYKETAWERVTLKTETYFTNLNLLSFKDYFKQRYFQVHGGIHDSDRVLKYAAYLLPKFCNNIFVQEAVV